MIKGIPFLSCSHQLANLRVNNQYEISTFNPPKQTVPNSQFDLAIGLPYLANNTYLLKLVLICDSHCSLKK